MARGVGPTARRLVDLYSREVVVGVLLDGMDPTKAKIIREETDELLSDYDRWTIEREAGAE